MPRHFWSDLNYPKQSAVLMKVNISTYLTLKTSWLHCVHLYHVFLVYLWILRLPLSTMSKSEWLLYTFTPLLRVCSSVSAACVYIQHVKQDLGSTALWYVRESFCNLKRIGMRKFTVYYSTRLRQSSCADRKIWKTYTSESNEAIRSHKIGVSYTHEYYKKECDKYSRVVR